MQASSYCEKVQAYVGAARRPFEFKCRLSCVASVEVASPRVALSSVEFRSVAFLCRSVPSRPSRVSSCVSPVAPRVRKGEPAMSAKSFQSVASVVPLKAARPEDSTEWRQLSGVALSILADLDRRRLKFVVSPQPEPTSKAA